MFKHQSGFGQVLHYRRDIPACHVRGDGLDLRLRSYQPQENAPKACQTPTGSDRHYGPRVQIHDQREPPVLLPQVDLIDRHALQAWSQQLLQPTHVDLADRIPRNTEDLHNIVNRQPRERGLEELLELLRDLPLSRGERRLMSRLAAAVQAFHSRSLHRHKHGSQTQRRPLPEPLTKIIPMHSRTAAVPATQRLTGDRDQHVRRVIHSLPRVLDSIALKSWLSIQSDRGHVDLSNEVVLLAQLHWGLACPHLQIIPPKKSDEPK